MGIGAYLSQPPVEEYAELAPIEINRSLDAHKDLPVEDGGDPEDALANNDATARNGSQTTGHNPQTTRPPVGGQVTGSANTPPQRGTIGSTPAGLDDLIGMGTGVNPNAGLPGQQALSSDSDIQNMISTKIGFYLPQIKSCYNSRLKEQEDLAGTWQASWKINRTGATSGVSVRGRGVNDAALESCIKMKIEKWTFQKINKDYPVTVPFDLGV